MSHLIKVNIVGLCVDAEEETVKLRILMKPIIIIIIIITRHINNKELN
jgi:hypothetical protein